MPCAISELTPHRARSSARRHGGRYQAIELAYGSAPQPSAALAAPPDRAGPDAAARYAPSRHRRAGRLREAQTPSRSANAAAPAQPRPPMSLASPPISRTSSVRPSRTCAARPSSTPISARRAASPGGSRRRSCTAAALSRSIRCTSARSAMSLSGCSSRRGSRKSPEHYSRALAHSPKFMVAHSNRGNALRALKQLPEADLSGGDRAQSALRASLEQFRHGAARLEP